MPLTLVKSFCTMHAYFMYNLSVNNVVIVMSIEHARSIVVYSPATVYELL